MSLRTKFPILSLNDKWEYMSFKFKCPRIILSLLHKNSLKIRYLAKKCLLLKKDIKHIEINYSECLY